MAYSKVLLAGILSVCFFFEGSQLLSAGPQPTMGTRGGSKNVSEQHRSILRLDDQSLENALAQNPVIIVDFYADWCSPCRRLLPIFEQVSKEMSNKLAFGKLYVDNAPQAMKKYKVSSIPTLIIFKNGREVSRKVGGMDKEGLKAFIHSAL